MIALDSDVLSDLFAGRPDYVQNLRGVPPVGLAVPVVVVEESLRGWLAEIQQASTGRARRPLADAYEELKKSVQAFGKANILPFTPIADTQFKAWRAAGVRIGTRDLRIAAITHTHPAKLITRNRKDFSQVPNLDVEYWN